MSVACHPGYAATNLQAAGPRMSGSSMMESMMAFKRAGADGVLTYFALDVARHLKLR